MKEKYDNTAIIKTNYEETSTSIWEQLAESGMENAPHVFEEDAEFDESKSETPEDKYFALAYKALGGNSFVDHVYEEVQEWLVIS